MSRTIRRKTYKSGLYEFDDYAGETRIEFRLFRNTFYIKPGSGARGKYIVLTKEHERKQKARFHSDSYETMRNAQKWYRRMLNKTLRTKQKQYLRNAIKNETFEKYAEPRFIKDAGWYW